MRNSIRDEGVQVCSDPGDRGVCDGQEQLFVREVNIVGDCVWAIYKTPRKADIDAS